MKKTIIVSIFLMQLFVFPCFSESLTGVPVTITNPQELVKWLSSDFKYRMKIPDEPQSLQDTLELRTGDCDDFTTLASEVLHKLGIDNKVVIIKLKGLDIYHALCVWQEEDGTYSFIDNKKLRCTKKIKMKEAITKFYPDCERITISKPSNKKLAYRR